MSRSNNIPLWGANGNLTSGISVSSLGGTTYSIGSFSKDITDASTTTNYAHGLGKTPKKITFYVSVNSVGMCSMGTWITGSTSFVYYSYEGLSGTSSDIRAYTQTFSNYQSGTITADATNITISWTKNGTPAGGYSGSVSFVCEG